MMREKEKRRESIKLWVLTHEDQVSLNRQKEGTKHCLLTVMNSNLVHE